MWKLWFGAALLACMAWAATAPAPPNGGVPTVDLEPATIIVDEGAPIC